MRSLHGSAESSSSRQEKPLLAGIGRVLNIPAVAAFMLSLPILKDGSSVECKSKIDFISHQIPPIIETPAIIGRYFIAWLVGVRNRSNFGISTRTILWIVPFV